MTSKIKMLEGQILNLQCSIECAQITTAEIRAVVALARESLEPAESYQAQRARHALGAVLTLVNELETLLEENDQ
jgi:hypothetical protein